MVRPFAPPDQAWGAGHRGIDLAATAASPVRALADGRVLFVGRIAGKGVVTVGLSDGRRVTYEPVDASVGVGDVVVRGQALGTLAAMGGHCGGAAGCLHVGLRRADAYLDPSSLLGSRPAVLKPD